MKNIRLTRVAANPEHGVFGTWVLDGQPISLSLEPYHRDNAGNISCIPAGQYLMKRHNSPKYGSGMWMVQDTQGRDYILVHWGNRDEDTAGCIILGEKFGVLGDDWAVLESRPAFNEFMNLTRGEMKLRLTIVDCY